MTTGYDGFITKVPKATRPSTTVVPKATRPITSVVAKATSPTVAKVPKPYHEEPNILFTEAGIGILQENGEGLLMEVG